MENQEQEQSQSSRKIRVDIEEIERWEAWKKRINSTPLQNIEFYKNGKKVRIPKSRIDDWRFIGMSNLYFIETGFYETGWTEINTSD